jgi:hypothetical protein
VLASRRLGSYASNCYFLVMFGLLCDLAGLYIKTFSLFYFHIFPLLYLAPCFILPIFSCNRPIGHIMHQALCFVIMPNIMAIIVDIKHIIAKIRPNALTLLFPAVIRRNTNRLITSVKTSHLNHSLVKIFGKALLRLTLERTRSKKEPLGHIFQHQNLALKIDKTSMKIMAIKTR